MLPCFALLLLTSCQSRRSDQSGGKKLIVLGIDGMDPQLLRKFMQEGKMPNFSRLVEQGSFRELTTSIPPQSPVAWSNLITGMNAGGHGIFDFIHRDPKTFELYFSTSRVEAPKHSLHVGKWVIPIGSGTAEQLRKGKAFWTVLDEHGIPNSVFRIPANFPPIPAKGETFSGMEPDLRGTYGTFTFYTDDPTAAPGAVEGGQIVPVQVENSEVKAKLIGPDNSFRKGSPPTTEEFKVAVDPLESVAKISFQDQEFVLREGEWSGWVPIEFQLIPILWECARDWTLLSQAGASSLSALRVADQHRSRKSRLAHLDSEELLTQLTEEYGEFTRKASPKTPRRSRAGCWTTRSTWNNPATLLAEHRRIFDSEFPKFKKGVFFFYFSSLDLNSHMFWRLIDPHHPEYDAARTAADGSALAEFYQQIDQVLGEVMQRMDDHTTLLVLSDHGFAPYDRSFNLNTWLLNHGYITLNSGTGRDSGEAVGKRGLEPHPRLWTRSQWSLSQFARTRTGRHCATGAEKTRC